MNRREFLKMLRGAPLAAMPTLTVSALALASSGEAYRRIDQAIQGDNVKLQGCEFKLNGSLHIHGDKAQISHSSFTNYNNSPAIKFS